jgi:hypothetical protein
MRNFTLYGFHPEKGQISRPEITNHARVVGPRPDTFPQYAAALQACRKSQPVADLGWSWGSDVMTGVASLKWRGPGSITKSYAKPVARAKFASWRCIGRISRTTLSDSNNGNDVYASNKTEDLLRPGSSRAPRATKSI